MSKIVKPKNVLKEKVGDGGFDEDKIEQAQTAIEENEVDFKPIAEQYLKQIGTAIEDHVANENFTTLKAELLDNLTQLRAQGSMFHYPSVSILTDSVVDLMDSLATIDGKVVEIVQAYQNSLKLLLASNIKDNKHQICVAICKELQTVCNKYKVKYG